MDKNNDYAVSNLQTLKENIHAYASFAKDHMYSPICEKVEAAQQAVQELIDAIMDEEEDDDTPELMRDGLDYIRENISAEDLIIYRAEVSKNLTNRRPADSGLDANKITDLLEELGERDDMPEGWWLEYGDIEDWLLKL